MRVKICGITTDEALRAAAVGGATYVGMVFYPASPRAVTAVTAAKLTQSKPDGVATVGLFVDPDDDTLGQVLDKVALDFIQLHGRETPERVARIRQTFGRPVIKAVHIRHADDLTAADQAEAAADQVLCDAAPANPQTAQLPGGNGLSFDWSILAGRQWHKPWDKK